jgi:hypothetical protein
MLTHLELHRGVTRPRSGEVVTHDTGPVSPMRGDVVPERVTVTSADTGGLTPGVDAGPARPRERMAMYLRGPWDQWRQWTSRVAVAVHAVGDRLRGELSPHGAVRDASDGAPLGPPYPLDPYAGAATRSAGGVDGEGATGPRAVPRAFADRRPDALGDERLHGAADLRPPDDGG